MKNRNILFTTILLALACFGLLPKAQAVSPAPDGGYPGNNTAEGDSALFSLTSGIDNTSLGFQALYKNNGNYNTAEGFRALYGNTSGTQNTANGVNALISNMTGGYNTATGVNSLYSNKSGSFNTANGYRALFNNLGGHDNMASGDYALYSNTTGNYNTADGNAALFSNMSGIENTAIGRNALSSNNAGNNNTAIGDFALASNMAGNGSTAVGYGALSSNSSGGCNIALGDNAGSNLTNSTGNIDIGNVGVAGDFGTIRIGQPGTFGCNQGTTFIAGIYGVNEGGTILPVYINSLGQLGTASSSRRYKKEIKPMDKASEAILALKPVTFHYKSDAKGTPQFGLIAEEVAEVNPDLVVRDRQGEIYSVRYDAVNAMLLNEFLKEHRKVEQQEATITQLKHDFQSTLAEQQKKIQALTASLKEQGSQIQKVSAQLEVSKPVPGVVSNDR